MSAIGMQLVLRYLLMRTMWLLCGLWKTELGIDCVAIGVINSLEPNQHRALPDILQAPLKPLQFV